MLAIDTRSNRVVRVIGQNSNFLKEYIVRNPQGERELIVPLYIKML